MAKKPKAFERSAQDAQAAALVGALQQAHGHDAAALLGMSEELGTPRGYCGTRNIAVDRGLGSPGLPLGRIIEVSGWEGSGKSTFLDQVLAEAQAQGGMAFLADVERARYREYQLALGVNPDALGLLQGTTQEQLFDEIETVTRHIASMNANAWVDALRRAGVDVKDCPTRPHETVDPRNPDRIHGLLHDANLAGANLAGADL